MGAGGADGGARGDRERGRDAELSLPTGARLLLLLALSLLAGGAAYGALGYDPYDHTDRWSSPIRQAAESGHCSRSLRLLPVREPRIPDFIVWRGATYVRGARETPTPERTGDTRQRFRGWRLLRSGDTLLLQRIGAEATAWPYAPGRCP